jgi:hypothetical protein
MNEPYNDYFSRYVILVFYIYQLLGELISKPMCHTFSIN